jgi:mutator protein MutT
MKQATLCILTNKESSKLLLGMKKRGFGQGKYNGFGGKIEPNETIEEAAVRELHEETNIKASPENIEKVGKLNFVYSNKQEWNQIVHVFIVRNWEGSPKESEEMKPEWFNVKDIPFHKMWADDKHWLPLILQGKKLEADIVFDKDNESIKDLNIKETI